METSEGDPVPIRILLQSIGTDITQTTLENTGLYLFIGLILCSAFLALASAVVAHATRRQTAQENATEGRRADYFRKKIHYLHSTAFLGHVVFLTSLLATGIYYFSYNPFTYGYTTALIVFISLLFYLLTLVSAHVTARRIQAQGTVNAFAFALYGLSRITKPVHRILAKLLRYTEPVDETAADGHTTLRDILGQNSVAPNSAEEKQILKGILNFSNIYVKQIMHPRTEVVAHDINMPFLRLCRQINENRYSRVPIYDGSLDKIKGILNIKDLLPFLNQNNDFEWQNLLREPYFVPETQKIDVLLQEFKRKKVHLAIVVDEYGGTSGIITLEDILEEIVGDIRDEFDEDEVNYSKLDKNNFVFEGKTPLIDVIRIMNLETGMFEDIRGEAETLGGLLVEILGSIPAAGEKVHYHDFCFTVENADGRRVRRVKISKPEVATA